MMEISFLVLSCLIWVIVIVEQMLSDTPLLTVKIIILWLQDNHHIR